MANTIKIAYGSTAQTTAKNNSSEGELSFSPQNEILWIGKGSNTQVAIGGVGKFVTLDTNQTITGTKTFNSTISGSISGNAGTANTLASSVNINGTSFNGSASINTATWGTPRNVTIGSTTRSVNGSTTYTWSLADIGAASNTHVHGNITNAGAIGSDPNIPLITGASGVIGPGSFGSAANTFCVGNDSRLSNPRTPVGTALTSGQIYVGSSSNLAAAVALSGDATLTNTGVITIGNNAITTAKISNLNVTLAKIQNIAGASVLGNSNSASGPVGQITPANADQVLISSDKGGNIEIGWTTIPTDCIANNAVTFAKIEDVAGRGILGRNATTSGDLSPITPSANNTILRTTSTGIQWSNTIDGDQFSLYLKGNDQLLPAAPSSIFHRELYYTSVDAKLYSVRGEYGGEELNEVIRLCGGPELIMYSDAAPEAEDSKLILSVVNKMRLTKVTYTVGAGTCTNAKLKKISGVNTNDIVTFSINTSVQNTTSLNSTHRELTTGDTLIFNPGTLSSGTTPEDLVIQIEYIPGAENTFG